MKSIENEGNRQQRSHTSVRGESGGETKGEKTNEAFSQLSRELTSERSIHRERRIEKINTNHLELIYGMNFSESLKREREREREKNTDYFLQIGYVLGC
jgi:hypothetical protein